MNGVVDKEGVEVVLGQEVLDVGLEVINEVQSVDDGVEALTPGLVVVLEARHHAEGEGFPGGGIEEVAIDDNGSVGVHAVHRWVAVRGLLEGVAALEALSEVLEAVAVLSVQSHLNVSELVSSELR